MKNLSILVVFLLLTVVMTYPLVMNATIAIAGPPGDGFIHLYEMYWFKRAIFGLHVWPLFDPETFYPFGYNLALSHITPSNTLVMMPIVLLVGPVAGFNGAVFLSFVLSGFGAYLLTLRLSRNHWAALLAGILFAFSQYRIHNLGAGWLPNLGTQWLPFALIYLDKLLTSRAGKAALTAESATSESPQLRRAARTTSPWRLGALAGFFFAMSCLSSWYHVYIAGVAVAVYALARGWPWRQRLFTRRTVAGGVAFAIIAILMILPLALPLLKYGSQEKDVAWPMISADDASASVDDLLLPSAYHPLWGDLALERRAETSANIVPGALYIGLPALLLGAYALRKRARAAWPVFLVGLVGAILALGLTLHVNGVRVYIPTPAAVENTFSRAMLTLAGKWALNHGAYTPFRVDGAIPIPLPGMAFWLFMPFGSTMRVFHRFGLDSSLAFAVLAGLGVAMLLARARAWSAAFPVVADRPRGGRSRRTPHAQAALALLLIAVVLVDIVAAPLSFGMSDTRASALDLWLRDQPGDFSVMFLPSARALNGPALYSAAIHGKKISYGYGTFYPKAWRVAFGPLGSFPNPEGIALLRSWNVRYVLIGENAYKAGLVDAAGDTWEKVKQRLQTTPGLRYVRSFDSDPPSHGDTLSAELTNPWTSIAVVSGRTDVYEVLPLD